MFGKEFTAKWGDKICLDLQGHSSYVGVKSDSSDETYWVTMNNQYLIEMAHEIIKHLT